VPPPTPYGDIKDSVLAVQKSKTNSCMTNLKHKADLVLFSLIPALFWINFYEENSETSGIRTINRKESSVILNAYQFQFRAFVIQ